MGKALIDYAIRMTEQTTSTGLVEIAVVDLSSLASDIRYLRGEFVMHYAQEKGWDPYVLTQEQMAEIRSQPDWPVDETASGNDAD